MFTDTFSRFNKIYLIKNLSTKEVINKFRKFIKRYQTPKAVLCDQGRQFISETFKRFLKKKEIKHIVNTAYNPRGNGITERVNKEISLLMRIYRNNPVKKIIKRIHNRLNFSYHSVIREIPNEIITQRNIMDNSKVTIQNEEILRRIAEGEVKNNKKTNKGRKKYIYCINDLVLLKKEIRGKGDELYAGPFTVTEISKKGNSVVVKDGNDKYEKISVRRIKPFFEGGSCAKIYDNFIKNKISSLNKNNKIEEPQDERRYEH